RRSGDPRRVHRCRPGGERSGGGVGRGADAPRAVRHRAGGGDRSGHGQLGRDPDHRGAARRAGDQCADGRGAAGGGGEGKTETSPPGPLSHRPPCHRERGDARRGVRGGYGDIAMNVPAVILGGSGYVAGEVLRLLAGHGAIRPGAVISESQAGEPVEAVFPHLAGCFPELKLSRRENLPELFDGWLEERVAVFCAAPHGAAAGMLDEVLGAAESAGRTPVAVDLSADFRFPTAEAYESVYGHPHGAPGRLASFTCAVPEHLAETPRGHVAHPGCFTTSVLLAIVPLLKLGLVEPRISVVATTGSTGSGRTPSAGTHHPARRSNLYAYNPLRHRHAPEMKALAAAASGVEPEIHFIPQ